MTTLTYLVVQGRTDTEQPATLTLKADGTSLLEFQDGVQEVSDQEVTHGLISAYLQTIAVWLRGDAKEAEELDSFDIASDFLWNLADYMEETA